MPRNRKKSSAGWRAVLNDFLKHFEIDSKEEGRVVMDLWGTQSRFLDDLGEGMDDGFRFFVTTKGRQYGVTTIMIPIDVLWCLIHPGIDGAIIANTPKVAALCRSMVQDVCSRLPENLKVPIVQDSRDLIRWKHDSTLHIFSAGTTERKTDLAKGHGLSFVHGTEVGEWGSEEALNSLIASLAQQNPNRLYVFESTGQGNNLFSRLWRRSLDHPARKCIFIPWWTHDKYKLDRRTKLYEHYMANPDPTPDEQEIIKAAADDGCELTDGQLAWYRSRLDEMTTVEAVRQNYPSTPEEAFQLGGSAFIPRKQLHMAAEEARAAPFKAYRAIIGADVASMSIEQLGGGLDDDGHVRGCDLRVWQEPAPRGIYSIGVDPKLSQNGTGDNATIQVLRCFSDCVEQVAEFASVNFEPYHLAWMVAYLAGWYKNSWVNIELQGGGRAMFRELKHLRDQVALGVLGQDGIFGHMMFYLYQRIDAASGNSRTWHFDTTETTKREIFLDFKDSFLTKRFILHSVPLTEEMAMLVDDNGHIGGDGDAEDGRPMAACIALRTWVDHIRLGMIAESRTRTNELRLDQGSAPATFLEDIVHNFMATGRARIQAANDQANWRR